MRLNLNVLAELASYADAASGNVIPSVVPLHPPIVSGLLRVQGMFKVLLNKLEFSINRIQHRNSGAVARLSLCLLFNSLVSTIPIARAFTFAFANFIPALLQYRLLICCKGQSYPSFSLVSLQRRMSSLCGVTRHSRRLYEHRRSLTLMFKPEVRPATLVKKILRDVLCFK